MDNARRWWLAPGLAVVVVLSGCGNDPALGTGAADLSPFTGGDDSGGGTLDLAGTAGADLLATPDLAGPCSVPAQSCYSGRPGSAGVGACQAGMSYCVAGVSGPCTGEIVPSTESCNGVDDDCNSMVDDGLGTVTCGVGACRTQVVACTNGRPTVCVPLPAAGKETCGNQIDDDCNGLVDEGCGCVYVAPSGSDMNGNGSAGSPLRTIGKAISIAGTNGLPGVVCVASGANCPSQADYPEAITMRNGISVQGGYQAAGMTWPRNAQCVTRILDQQPSGVSFDASVQAPTVLDGFVILGRVDPMSAAVTVRSSTGAVISNCTITGAGTMISYGVDIISLGGVIATPLIQRCGIAGGNGTSLSIGVHSVGSAPVLRANCDTIDANTGRCTSGGCGGNAVRFIRSRTMNGNGTESYGVRLQGSPGAVIEQSAVCGFGSSGDQAAVRISGDAKGVLVRASNINAFGPSLNSVGVWADSCAAASPWILGNQQITANSALMGGRADGVRAVGDCHPRIDSNNNIVGGVESANNDANGVYCVRDAQSGISSRCTVLNNGTIYGAGQGFPPRSAGVHCDDGACARIENNQLISARSGIVTYGVRLKNTNTFVHRNTIDAGCARMVGTGLASESSFARVQNNVITGAACPNGAATGESYAVRVLVAAGVNELDLHSNDLFGGGVGPCVSRGLAFDLLPGAMAPAGPLGVVRNNILGAGMCATRYSVEEQSASAEPRLLENNDLWAVNGAPTALYRDEAMSNLAAIPQVNMLVAGPVAAANISADPLLGAGLHLPNNSPCVNTGTPAGAPHTDFDGDARPQQQAWDIGADEYK